MPDPKRILLIRRKAIGDIVVSMPVAAALRNHWPEARIHMLVDRFAVGAVRGSPYVDQLIVYNRRRYAVGDPSQRFRASVQWLRRLRTLRYDLVLDLMGTPQTAMWTRVTGAATRVGRDRRFRTWAYNVVLPRDHGGTVRFAGEEFLDWVRAVGVGAGPWSPLPLARPGRIDAHAAEWLRSGATGSGPVVVVNPSATWSAKAWPLKHFADLSQLLVETLDAQVVVAWGPGEETARDTVVRLSDGAARPLPATDLTMLTGFLAAADLVITTDSGPKHLAVAEGTPTLTLFGSTDPRGWQPPGREHRWISHDVPCRPCNLTECIVPGHPCLDDLPPSQVVTEAVRMLREPPAKDDA